MRVDCTASQPPELSPTTRVWARSACSAAASVWERKACRLLSTHLRKLDMSVSISVLAASGTRRKSAERMIALLKRASSGIRFVKKRGGSEAPVTYSFCVSEGIRSFCACNETVDYCRSCVKTIPPSKWRKTMNLALWSLRSQRKVK